MIGLRHINARKNFLFSVTISKEYLPIANLIPRAWDVYATG